ncbi:saccharopine dehydrogenase family protein [Salinibaculum salinum]|uniref:saccharopine dehydrogenase family protein n=1 Tax=Salinibaculum salinum TaxID=3131996 RepID=UPI0030ECB852
MSDDTTALVYGAYGYTGELVARTAVEADIEPILAGRRENPLRKLAAELELEYRAFGLDDPVAPHLADVDVVAHCAGPFVDTYQPMVDACLATETHYLDITGEIPVLEAIKQYDELAADAGLMFLPGAGFDVVPSDCLAAHLHERLPDATELTVAFDAGGIEASAGTMKTMVEGLGEGSAVRENDHIVSVPYGERTRVIDTGEGPQTMTAFPWGDVSTAHHSTGIPNIGVYVPVSERGQRVMRAMDVLGPVLSAEPVKRALQWGIEQTAEGPDKHERETGSASFYGEATNGEETVRSRVRTPETYQFTAESVVEILDRVLAGEAVPGYQTPSSAYGSEFVLAIDGCSFEDLD